LNVLALLALNRLLRSEWKHGSSRERGILTAALVAFYPVFCALSNGQTSILLAIAVLCVHLATERSNPWAAAGWLLVLTIKPQLFPAVSISAVVRLGYRVVACTAIIFAAAAAVTALVLGPAVWVDYFTNVHLLEKFWGTGTPSYMLNLRGTLARSGWIAAP